MADLLTFVALSAPYHRALRCLLYAGTPEGGDPIRAGDVISAQGEGLGAMQVKVVAAP